VKDKFPNLEELERRIDGLVGELAEREGMNPDDILSDIVTFAPYDGNDAANPDYLEEVAERMGISVDEMRTYALKKAKDFLED